MKTTIYFFLIISLFFSPNILAQKLKVPQKSEKKQILLLHPTVGNIKTIQFLIQNKIFTLPTDYKIVGVYHTLGKYDYKQSAEYIKNEPLDNFSLIGLEPELSPVNIYKENPCTPQFLELFENSQGAIFFGGNDIPAVCFGEETNLLTVTNDIHRHYIELSFLFHLLGGYQDSTFIPLLEKNPDFTILGICLGMQTINVATGGTLYQDIPTEIYKLTTVEQVLALDQNNKHRNYYTNFATDSEIGSAHYHQLYITADFPYTQLIPDISKKPFVLSSHHQGVKKTGKNIRTIAFSEDGRIPEMIFHEKYKNVIGVQFHPEVSDIYKPDKKIKSVPEKKPEFSYKDLYPGPKGETFHYAFWKFISEKFSEF